MAMGDIVQSSKVTWVLLSIHIVHTPILDKPIQTCNTFSLYEPFVQFSRLFANPHIQCEGHTPFLTRPFSHLIIRVSSIVQESNYTQKPIFQHNYMKHIFFLSRPFSSPIISVLPEVTVLCQVA